MEYKLYTLIDITNTGQHRVEHGKEVARLKEQNFQTVIQTLGIRANVSYYHPPAITEVRGSLVGFATDDIVRVWRFDFYTERDNLFENDGDPVGFLKDDFELVPFIHGLNETVEQKYNIFVTYGDDRNIVFHKK